jgi:hypothetical protein
MNAILTTGLINHPLRTSPTRLFLSPVPASAPQKGRPNGDLVTLYPVIVYLVGEGRSSVVDESMNLLLTVI